MSYEYGGSALLSSGPSPFEFEFDLGFGVGLELEFAGGTGSQSISTLARGLTTLSGSAWYCTCTPGAALFVVVVEGDCDSPKG